MEGFEATDTFRGIWLAQIFNIPPFSRQKGWMPATSPLPESNRAGDQADGMGHAWVGVLPGAKRFRTG